jgi:rubrerythrin
MSQKFQRKKEDFTCEHCGVFVIGNGYTNHCPQCLWGKHVDVFPGDRASECGELMRPAGFTMKKQQFVIIHKCVKCGYIGKNKIAPNDNIDTMTTLKQGI